MPINKHALIRYKTLDNCLQNRFRKWTLDDLVEACAEALYEYEGVTKGISRRTVQMDIQMMRSEKLGYNAPIVVTDKKFYSYSEKNYSITNIPLTGQDLSTLNEVVDILKQFKGFGYFDELTGMISRLEDKIQSQQNKGRTYIDFEKNDQLKGINLIEPLHKAIIKQVTLQITYQSFKADRASDIILYPYLLKEYRNRWFILGANKKGGGWQIMALDRIANIKELPLEPFVKNTVIDTRTFFSDVIGVSKMPTSQPMNIILKVDKANAPYVVTKPLHKSQKILKEEEDGLLFSIDVVWNFEVEREILGFGEAMRVVAPSRLVRKIRTRIRKMAEAYDTIKEKYPTGSSHNLPV